MGGKPVRVRTPSGRRRASRGAGSNRGMWVASLALVLAIVGTVVALLLPRGSTPGQTRAGESIAPSPSSAPVPIGIQPGQRAPDFRIETSDGDPFRLSSYRGQEVVLDFLAPGCPSCAAEVPSLRKAREAFEDEEMTVIVIDVGGGPIADAVAYYRSVGAGASFLYAADEGFRVARQYEVLSLGTTIVIDPRGIVTFRDSGPSAADVLTREIGRALT